MRSFFVSTLGEFMLVGAILFGLCFVNYSNSLHNTFMLDDSLIFSDIKLNNIKFLPNAFFYPTAHSDNLDNFIGSKFYYRPMAYIVTLLTFQIFGQNPVGYHIFNLILFTLMSLMVYIFVLLFFKNRLLAFITSILFALHPINVFYVNYITSPLHSIRFIFMFLSLIFFLKAQLDPYKYIFYLVSFFCFIVTLMCHETSVVLPFYVIFTAFFFNKSDIKEALLKSGPYWLILLLYLFFRFECTGLRSTLPAVPVNPIFYLATFSKIIFLYITKLFCPQGIIFYWNSPWIKGFKAFIWISGLLVLVFGWWRLIKINPRSLYSFCATWLLMGFIPVLLAAFPPYDKMMFGLLIEPQWVTFASAGFFLYVADRWIKLFEIYKKGAILIFIFLAFILIFLTRGNNEIWGDEYKYYFYWRQQIEPLPGINYAYLAEMYTRKKEYPQARYYFIKALNQKPEAFIFYNLGLIDMQSGDINRAKQEFLLSIKTDPQYSLAYNNLGAIYFNEKDYKAAKEAFLRTILLDKYCIEARSNLGFISLMQADYKEAINYYLRNLDIVPYEEDSLLGLVQAYAALKDFNNMDKYAQLLLKHTKDPNHMATLKNFLDAHPH